jgi:hypothetical protein
MHFDCALASQSWNGSCPQCRTVLHNPICLVHPHAHDDSESADENWTDDLNERIVPFCCNRVGPPPEFRVLLDDCRMFRFIEQVAPHRVAAHFQCLACMRKYFPSQSLLEFIAGLDGHAERENLQACTRHRKGAVIDTEGMWWIACVSKGMMGDTADILFQCPVTETTTALSDALMHPELHPLEPWAMQVILSSDEAEDNTDVMGDDDSLVAGPVANEDGMDGANEDGMAWGRQVLSQIYEHNEAEAMAVELFALICAENGIDSD